MLASASKGNRRVANLVASAMPEKFGLRSVSIEDLSDEIIQYILSYLDHRALLRCACLSNRFKRLALDNNLWYFINRRQRPTLTRFTKYNLRVNYRPLFRDDYLFTHTLNDPARISVSAIDIPYCKNESIEWIERYPNLDDTLIAFSCIIKNEEKETLQYSYRLVVRDLNGPSEFDGEIDFPPITMEEDMQMTSYQSVLSICKQKKVIALGVWQYAMDDIATCLVELRELGGSFNVLHTIEVPGYVEQLELYFKPQMETLFDELKMNDDFVMWYFRRDNVLEGTSEELYTYSQSTGHVKRCNFPIQFQDTKDVYYNPHHFTRTMVSVHILPNNRSSPSDRSIDSIVDFFSCSPDEPIRMNVWSFFEGTITKSFPITQCQHSFDNSTHLLTHEELGIWILYGRIPIRLAFPESFSQRQTHVLYQPSSLLFHYFDPSLPSKNNTLHYISQVGLQGVICCYTHEGCLITLEDDNSVAVYCMEDLVQCHTTGLHRLRQFFLQMRADVKVKPLWKQTLPFNLDDVSIGENVVLCFRSHDGNVWILVVVRRKVWKIKFDLPYKVLRKANDTTDRGIKENCNEATQSTS